MKRMFAVLSVAVVLAVTAFGQTSQLTAKSGCCTTCCTDKCSDCSTCCPDCCAGGCTSDCCKGK
jgi:hypothetical protein